MIKDHSKSPLQTVFGADCKRWGWSPRQPAGEVSTDSFLVSARSFLFSHFCCIHIAPARCRSRKETGKVKVTHAQALPSPSRAPLQKSPILAAETRNPHLPHQIGTSAPCTPSLAGPAVLMSSGQTNRKVIICSY